MSTKTGIEWTDSTWNPIRGCSRVSEGCRHCYAESVAYRFSGPGQPYEGLVMIGADGERKRQWNGNVQFAEKHLLDPFKWKRIELAPAHPPHGTIFRRRRIFVNSMSDLFHPNVKDEWIDKIFAVMALCPQHTFQVLTKRPERMLEYLANRKTDQRVARASVFITPNEMLAAKGIEPDLQQEAMAGWANWPLPNVWLGVSVENQETADERIPLLLKTPAAKRFMSAEPLLGPLDVEHWAIQQVSFGAYKNALGATTGLHWVIAGGESGPGARPMRSEWARGLRDQCVAAGVPFFFKQWGEWLGGMQDAPISEATGTQVLNAGDTPVRVGKKAAGALLDGREWKEFPR